MRQTVKQSIYKILKQHYLADNNIQSLKNLFEVYNDICSENNISYGSLRKYADREKWNAEKELVTVLPVMQVQKLVEKCLVQAVAEERADYCRELARDTTKLYNEALKVAAQLLTFDQRKLYDNGRLKKIHELDDDTVAAIKTWKFTAKGKKSKDDNIYDVDIEGFVDTYDKLGALKLVVDKFAPADTTATRRVEITWR
jgi:hypothetical protein